MYRCDSCGATFGAAVETMVRENLDGERGVWLHSVEICPYCGEEFIEEVSEDEP